MDSMDVKGIAWVGNIYQKFEAMCLEVEEAMCQETAKYVENQVQTVGASMKRFCSDVMQDLLPPSSKDVSGVASAELLLNPYLEFGIHMKPIPTFKEDPVHVKGISENIKGISEGKNEDKSRNDDAWEDWSAASFNWEISDGDKDEEAKCDRMMTVEEASNEQDIESETRGGGGGGQEGQICNLTVGTSPAPTTTTTTTTTTAFAKSSVKGGKRSGCISSTNIIIKPQRTTGTSCEGSGLASQKTSSGHGDVSCSDACESSNSDVSLTQTGLRVSGSTECGQSVGDEVFLSHTTADCDPDLEKENNTSTSTSSIERTEEAPRIGGFEETCVLVDGNDYDPTNSPKQETRRRLYKKKIQGAFSLKSNSSSRKQEYKQLVVAQYDDNLLLTFPQNKKQADDDKLPTRGDSIDSEWELL